MDFHRCLVLAYGGCFRKLRINDKAVSFDEDITRLINVNLDGCPKEEADLVICQEIKVMEKYDGNLTEYIDERLFPFTG